MGARRDPITLRDGTELKPSARFTFTADEAAVIHEALRAALHEAIARPLRDPRAAQEEKYELARLLSKIDGRLRPIG